MAAIYRSDEAYRDSLRSAQSASVYSTDSTSSPLDSIIRDYPLVPGQAPFQFSPTSYASSPKTPSSSASRNPRQQGLTTRMQQPEDTIVTTPNPSNLAFDTQLQAHERSGSSPLLHTRFRSPTDSISVDPHPPDSSQVDTRAPDNFIDLRESGAYEHIDAPKGQHGSSGFNPYGYGAHGVPPRQNHGVTPLMQFGHGNSLRPAHREQTMSRFSPATPDIEIDVEFPAPTRANPASSYGQHPIDKSGLAAGHTDTNYDRNSWGTQYSEQNVARQTWMTTTSAVTNNDPFSFRHFESPQASDTPPRDPNFAAPKLVVHSPSAHDSSQYPADHFYSSGIHYQDAQEDEPGSAVDTYAYVPPSPIELVPQGRVPSKVPVANRYNFSRPMRTELAVSDASTHPTAVRGSEYSSVSASTDIPHTMSRFPDPPMPDSLAPSQQGHSLNPSDQATQRAMKRMSVPKTVPNLVYTDAQLSPSPTRREIASSNSPQSNGMQLNGSPGGSGMNQNGLSPRSLSPIRDRSPSPSGGTSESIRYQSQSPLPGPPRSYDVPYSYRVTITDHQYHAANSYDAADAPSSHSHSSDLQHRTRYSQGGSALPPAPKEIVALPSSPPPVMPRPGSGLSLYSRYSFYSAGDLPDSAATTPRGWEKNGSAERLRANGGVSPSKSDRTPTPTGAKNKGKGKAIVNDDYSGLPYLDIAPTGAAPPGPRSAATDQSRISPQECLLLGISHHEADRLEESAYWFEKAANENGGCGVGMFMWGLSLRHAWGVERDERAAFWWLRRAAECAVQDMERTTQAKEDGDVEKERDRKAVQSELVLAVYEVGQCFFHGWGVETDKKMAVSYFQVAARLGDMDAQLELGFCFAKGKGCKKDLKESAKWYRAAAAQGASTIGLAWIYKPKYGGPGGDEQFTDTSSNPVLPSPKATTTSSAKSSSGKSEPRRLKKPPPRSRTPSAMAKSPAPSDDTRSPGMASSVY